MVEFCAHFENYILTKI